MNKILPKKNSEAEPAARETLLLIFNVYSDFEMKSSHVLLLRAVKSASQPDSYISTLQTAGFQATCLNVLSFTFINIQTLSDALHNSNEYSGLILSSPRTVTALQKATESNPGVMKLWTSKKVYVVGKATHKAAAELGLLPVGEQSGTGEVLVQYITKDLPANSLPLLIPCGNLTNDVVPTLLRDKGISTKCITVYETCPAEDIKETVEEYVKTEGVPDYVVFFSPSGVRSSLPALRTHAQPVENIKLIAIGPTTHSALLEHDLAVHSTAATPDPVGVLDAVREHSEHS